jgi:hypothetical protein
MRDGKNLGAGSFFYKRPLWTEMYFIGGNRGGGSNTSALRHNQGYFIIKIFDFDFMRFKLDGSILLTDLLVG